MSPLPRPRNPLFRLPGLWLALASLPVFAQTVPSLGDPDPVARVKAIRALPLPPADMPADHLAQVVELLDDSTRVVLKDGTNRVDLATSPAREARRYLVAAGAPVEQRLLAALAAQRPSLRWRVAQVLGEMGGPAAADALLDAMSQDTDELVRMTAAEALVNMGTRATPALLELLREGTDPQVEQAIWVLSESKDDRALGPLLNLALRGAGKNAQRATDAVLKIGPRVFPQILAVMENPETPLTERVRAVRIGSQIAHPAMLNSLCFLVLAGDETAVREEALSTLAGRKDDPAVIDTLLNALYDVDRHFANRVPEVMRYFDGRAAVILEGYLANPSPRLQAYAIEGLRHLGAESIPTFVHLVESPLYEFPVRQQAAAYLKRLGYRGITFDTRVNAMTLVGDWAGLSLLGRQLEPHYVQMLDHAEPSIREAGINLLSDLQSSRYTSRYLDLTMDRDALVRSAALRALTKLDRLSFPEMARQLDRRLTRNVQSIGDVLLKGGYRPRTDYDRLRLFAAVEDWDNVTALGESAVALLLERMRGEDTEVAAWAAWTMARLGDRTSLDKLSLKQLDNDLHELLFEEEDIDRRAAYRVLGSSNERKSAPFLLVPLLMRDEMRRGLAAEALGTQGNSAMKFLELALSSDTPLLQERALLALKKCGPVAYPVLLRHMNDPGVSPAVLATLDDMNYRPGNTEEESAYFLATHEYTMLARLGRRALKPLMDAASDPRNPDRVRAILAMGGVPDENLNDSLVVLLNDTDAAVRQAVVDTFRGMGEAVLPSLVKTATFGGLIRARSAALLLSALKYEPRSEDEDIWLAAARNDWPGLQARKDRAFAILRPSLLDENAQRRALAANAISAIHEYEIMSVRTAAERISPDLLSSLRDENPESRALAAYLCGQYGAGRTNLVANLLPLLADNTPVLWSGENLLGIQIRPTPGVHAAAALAKIGPAAIPALLRHYEQSGAEARFNASLALCSIPDPALLKHQIRALQEPEYELRYKAVESLGLAGRSEALAPMVNAAMAPGSNLAQPVLEAVRRIGLPALPGLRRELEAASSANRRRFLLELAGQLRSPDTIPVFVPYLVDNDIQVRKVAYQGLSQIDHPTAVGAVIDALSDEYWTVRESAAGHLVEAGPRVVPQLIDQLRADNSPKSRYIQRVLQQITGEGFGPDVDAWKKWAAGRAGKTP
ncbi:MAG: HEAT repeat domain-containing protein [Kiritimatiellia bacterium]